MKNLNLGMIAFATLPGALFAQETAKSEAYIQSRPNVVMIYADDLGYGDLECYGATGVKTPVRPTWIVISRSVVIARAAGNLYATSHRGLFARLPMRSCVAMSFTFSTSPSISNGISGRINIM